MIQMLLYMEAVDSRADVIDAESTVINQKTAQNAREILMEKAKRDSHVINLSMENVISVANGVTLRMIVEKGRK